jgi:hypothetical protein
VVGERLCAQKMTDVVTQDIRETAYLTVQFKQKQPIIAKMCCAVNQVVEHVYIVHVALTFINAQSDEEKLLRTNYMIHMNLDTTMYEYTFMLSDTPTKQGDVIIVL